MRFTFPTATIASIGGAAYLATSTAVAASVSVAYENPGSIRAASKSHLGMECSFEKGALTVSPDVGVLSCDTGEMCVEDSTSRYGGRCVVSEAKVAVEPQRELQCDKCTGIGACFNANQTNIGCGSCIGTRACNNLPNNVIVGQNSCVGTEACRFINSANVALLNIGDNSCRDNVACKYLAGMFEPVF